MRNSSPTCVDANLVVHLVTDYDDVAVQDLWHRWRDERSNLVAPTLLRYEVTNALHRLRRAGDLSNDETRNAIRAALALPLHLYGEDDLHSGALDFAARFDLPAAYDAHYLALADRLGAEFWTTDRRLANKVRPTLPWVCLVGE